VVRGELLDQFAREREFATHENPLPRHKDIFENDKGLVPSEEEIALVERPFLTLPGVAGLPSDDVEDPFRIARKCERDRIFPVILPHGQGRHDQDLMRIDSAGLVGLGAPHHNPVLSPLHNVKEGIRVGLLVRGKRPVSLCICHGPVHGEVVFLHVREILQETLVVLGSPFRIDVVADYGNRIQRIHAHASLKAAPGFAAEQSSHFALLHQVIYVLVNVRKAVDALSREVRPGRHDLLILRLFGHFIRLGHSLHGRADDWMIDHILHPFTEHVDIEFQLSKGLFILFGVHHRPFLLR